MTSCIEHRYATVSDRHHTLQFCCANAKHCTMLPISLHKNLTVQIQCRLPAGGGCIDSLLGVKCGADSKLHSYQCCVLEHYVLSNFTVLCDGCKYCVTTEIVEKDIKVFLKV